MSARLLCALTIPILALSGPAFGHGGGLDELGCHHNRREGGYHCHQGPLAGRAFGSKAEALDALGEGQRGQRSDNSSASACPCGSGKVCVGPRGGRYCLTPSGNKRYGQ